MREGGALADSGRMAAPRRFLAVLVVLLVVGSLMPLGPLASGLRVPLRVMPLGNSITKGEVGSSDSAGYRNDLFASLTTDGFAIDMVGSQADGSGFDNDHEGRNGWRANQIRDGVIGWLDANPADVVLLHIGTNDISDGQATAGIVTEISQTLDNIDTWEQTAGNNLVWVVLARIINRSDPTTTTGLATSALNASIQAMADSRIAAGDRLIVVDMESALVYPDDMSDEVHPTDGGYAKMAGVWDAGLDGLFSDSTPPVIVLSGPNPQTFAVGDTYVELGATASDNLDGDISSQIVVDSSAVDTNSVGSYPVTYDVSDWSRNVAARVVRIVEVVAVDARIGGAVVEYLFLEGSGSVVGDSSGVGVPLDLTVGDVSRVSWVSGGGLRVEASTTISSGVAASKVISAVQGSNQVSVEAWVDPANLTQNGPARIVSISSDTATRNVMLGQGVYRSSGDRVEGRVRNSTSVKGTPTISSPVGSLSGGLTHLVLTRVAGTQALYIDGVLVATGSSAGTLANWAGSFPLLLANELTGDRPWLGEYCLVAVYDTALTPAEVTQNFQAGCPVGPPPPPDSVPPVISLVGADPLVLELNVDPYVELGATASDNVDGDISADVVIDSSAVDTTVVGSYPVFYDVVDSSENPAVQVIRTVNVVDTTPPVIVLLGNDPQTVVVDAGYVESGAVVTDNQSAPLVLMIDDSGLPVPLVEGTYQVLYDVTDDAGNPAVQVTRTVNVVAPDGVPPVISLVGADPLVLELNVDPYVELGATASDNVDGDISADVVIDSSAVDTTVVGSYPVFYDVVDSSENPAVQVTRTVNVVDTTPPVIVLSGPNPQTFAVGESYVESGASVTDNQSAPITALIDATGLPDPLVEGTYQVLYDATDDEGNPAARVVRIVEVVAVDARIGGAVVEYLFLEGSGSVVGDSSGVGVPLDLMVGDVSRVSWVSGGGLRVEASTTISSGVAASKVISAVQGSNQVSVEAWVDPANLTQNGPARIVSISSDTATRNVMLGQGVYRSSGDRVEGRVRNSTSVKGTPTISSPVGSLSGGLTHLVLTRVAGTQALYIDGVLVATGSSAGTLANWAGSFPLLLANELTGDRPWLGEYCLVAVYDTALTPAEVTQNFQAGCPVGPPPPPDSVPPVISLVGADPLVLELNVDPYVELGATASDNVDGDISADVVIDSSAVDTTVVGSYPVFYDVVDSSENPAVQVIRTVNVVDTTPPVIVLLGNDPQTVVVDAGYVESGAVVTDNQSAPLVLMIDDSGLPVPLVEGTYQVLYDVTDDAGNPAVQVTRTVNVVAPDGVPPVISLVGADPLVLELNVDPYVELGATASDNVDGDISADVVIDSSAVDTTVVGSYPVFYDVVDSSENPAVQVIRTVNVVDTTPPVIVLSGPNPQTFAVGESYVESGASVTDNQSAPITALIDATGLPDPLVEGTYQVLYDATDDEGNPAARVVRIVEVVAVDARIGGAVVEYLFLEGSGSVVGDSSGVGVPLDLMVGDVSRVSWVSGGGLRVEASTTISSGVAASKVISAVQGSNQVSVEAWVDPANLTQNGPARIVSISSDTATRNVMLGQGVYRSSGDRVEGRVRNSTSVKGTPTISSPVGSLSGGLTHLVLTRVAGTQALYIDGVLVATGSSAGTLANWAGSFPLLLANELTGDRPWLGEYCLVAVYDTALTPAEVTQNFQAGCPVGPPPPPDSVPPVISLVGADPLVLELNVDPYVELGATASDNVDGDISADVVIDSSAVDTTVVGSYPVFYDVVDSSENPAVQVTRTVNVVDTTPPVIVLLGNDPQTVVVDAGYVESGAVVTDNQSAPLVLMIDDSGLPVPLVEGTYQVLYDVTDDAGNPAVQVTRTVNVVAPDGVPPVISLVGADPLVLELNVDPYVELGATASDNVDGDISADVVIDSSAVDTTLVGSYPVFYDVVDSSENPAVQVIRTVNVVDTTPPVIVLSGPNPQTFAVGESYVESGASVTDNQSAPITALIDATGLPDPLVEGTYQVLYDATDDEGNPAARVTRTVTVTDVDTDPPVIDPGQDFSLPANGTPGTYVDTVAASDLSPITGFVIAGGAGAAIFSIDSTGRLYLVDPAPLTQGTVYDLLITATDSLGYTSPPTPVSITVAPAIAGLPWEQLSSKTGDLPTPNNWLGQGADLIFDIDRDGDQDFVLAGGAGPEGAVIWYRQSAAGWIKYPISNELLKIATGGDYHDIDGDGDLDLVLGGDENQLWWWENPYPDFDISTPWVRRSIRTEGPSGLHDQLFGDFDGDGQTELAFWNQRGRQLLLAEIPADPTVAEPWPQSVIYTWTGSIQVTGLARADIDRDGIDDIVGAGRWFKHESGTVFSEHVIDATQLYTRVRVGQLIPGGRPEVVFVAGDTIGPMAWYEWDGAGWITHQLLGVDVDNGHSLDLGDVNEDGHLDIFVAEMRLNDLNPDAFMLVLFGDGSGRFATTSVVTGQGHHEVAAGGPRQRRGPRHPHQTVPVGHAPGRHLSQQRYGHQPPRSGCLGSPCDRRRQAMAGCVRDPGRPQR